MRSWAQKLIAFPLDTVCLYKASQSDRSTRVVLGSQSTIRVQILPPMVAKSYQCTLNTPNIKQALELAEAATGTKADITIQEEFVQNVVQSAIDKNGSETIVRVTPGVHCELALLHHIRSQSLEVFPYLGSQSRRVALASSILICIERP
ncbi:hypothetical protein BT96DRAFT_700017 [Gymnopus androsaceus JB14]|uniref:Uncharacterized protein n=1 Tax=Gymnopus androsaceus JB14 TaxID=1447944 RepID=A0A6A4IIW0_9AGAR|nr:hypothetical protein BT96DRAFT_700017 [Gymnopus androsaceus JB14]